LPERVTVRMKRPNWILAAALVCTCLTLAGAASVLTIIGLTSFSDYYGSGMLAGYVASIIFSFVMGLTSTVLWAYHMRNHCSCGGYETI